MEKNQNIDLDPESPEGIADMKAVLEEMTGQPVTDDDAKKALKIIGKTVNLARLHTAGAVDAHLGDMLLKSHQKDLKKIVEKKEGPEVK